MKKKRGTSQEDIDDKVMRAHALEERLEAIPDGSGARRGVGGAAPGGLRAGIGSMGGPGRVQIDTLTADEIEAHPEYAQTSEESRAFRQEWENAKARQGMHEHADGRAHGRARRPAHWHARKCAPLARPCEQRRAPLQAAPECSTLRGAPGPPPCTAR